MPLPLKQSGQVPQAAVPSKAAGVTSAIGPAAKAPAKKAMTTAAETVTQTAIKNVTDTVTSAAKHPKPNVADEVFTQLRDMAIRYELKPGERLNEVALSTRLGVSRTPVREALYRLAQDGFLVASGRGYSRRALDVKETMSLFEARTAVEVESVRLAASRGSEAALADIEVFLDHSLRTSSTSPVAHLVELDEGFHERIAIAANNNELLRMLKSLNERIRFIRWISMETVGRDNTQAEHRKILIALKHRDAVTAEQLIRSHIGRRNDQIVQAITTGLARIYLGDAAQASS